MPRTSKQLKVALASDPFERTPAFSIESPIANLTPYETFNALRVRGSVLMPYGVKNNFPKDFFNAFQLSSTAVRCFEVFKSMVIGNGLQFEQDSKPNLNESWSKLFTKCIFDALFYHQFALKLCSNLSGNRYTFSFLPMQFLRISPDNSTVSVSLDWTKNDNVITYPLYNGGSIDDAVEYVIIFSNLEPNELFYSYKASPLAIDCLSESSIHEFYSGNLSSGFQPQVMLSLPYTPDNWKEFTTKLKQSYCGVQNADKLMIVAGDGEKAPTFTAIPTVDLDKYQNTSDKVIDSIIAWFGCPRELLGIDTNTGFSNGAEELLAKVSVWEKFTISPLRTFILDSLNSMEDLFDTPHFSIEPSDVRTLFATGKEDKQQAKNNNTLNKGDEIRDNKSAVSQD